MFMRNVSRLQMSDNKERYGYRRILHALRQEDNKIHHKTVYKLMKSMGLQGKNVRANTNHLFIHYHISIEYLTGLSNQE